MNKITMLDHIVPERTEQGFQMYTDIPTVEQMQAHITEMNSENWKMINCMRTGNNDMIFFWEKDAMLAEVANG